MRVYVDTSAWISLVAERDPHHTAVAREWTSLLALGAVPVTSSDVVSETLTCLRYHAGHAIALRFYALLGKAVEQERLLLCWVDAALFEQAWQIFRTHRDHEFSMVDCTSFALCRREKIARALTLDRHFHVAGLEVIPG